MYLIAAAFAPGVRAPDTAIIGLPLCSESKGEAPFGCIAPLGSVGRCSGGFFERIALDSVWNHAECLTDRDEKGGGDYP